mmetsp:Transcript_25538/g.82299  ORF Transcript_25538/g.82299 Transcript_25538/m.82299 type:complete len:247 (-) Transcript_25538:584-1324(-)
MAISVDNRPDHDELGVGEGGQQPGRDIGQEIHAFLPHDAAEGDEEPGIGVPVEFVQVLNLRLCPRLLFLQVIAIEARFLKHGIVEALHNMSPLTTAANRGNGRFPEQAVHVLALAGVLLGDCANSLAILLLFDKVDDGFQHVEATLLQQVAADNVGRQVENIGDELYLVPTDHVCADATLVLGVVQDQQDAEIGMLRHSIPRRYSSVVIRAMENLRFAKHQQLADGLTPEGIEAEHCMAGHRVRVD